MTKNNRAKVYLVGAGPGDIGLLTVRGAALLRTADVVIYDHLVNPHLLELAPHAEKILAGKKGGKKHQSVSQDDILNILLRTAKQKKKIVRLKGGDPFVFGRGGEEAEFLKNHRIDFEVISGVSAGHAVPASAGIPVTDRRYASTVTFVTANEDPEKENSTVPWKELAKISGTLVLFMGVGSLDRVAKKLIQNGKSPTTLVTVIENGTLPNERIVEGTLETIASKVQRAGIQPPAITVVGEVNQIRKKIFSPVLRPLQGKSILITRAQHQASALRMELERYGAQVFEFAAIQIAPPKSWKPLDQAINQLASFDWILFTSAHAVEAFFSRLYSLKKDIRTMALIKIAAVGKSTAALLQEKGLKADLIPSDYTRESLFKTLKARKLISGKRFFIPHTDIAPDFLKKNLAQAGAQVTEVTAYRTLPPSKEAKQFLREISSGKKKMDYVTFTSASTVRNFFDSIPSNQKKKLALRAVSIGPVTSQTLRSYGIKPYCEAKEHTIHGLVKALLTQ